MSLAARAAKVAPKPENPPKDGVPFTEDFKFVDSSCITFSSESLQAWIDKTAQQNFPFWMDHEHVEEYEEQVGSHLKKYRFQWKRMPCYELGGYGGFLSMLSPRWSRTTLHCGRGKWWNADGDLMMPVITEHTWADTEVVMSLTPMEVKTLRGCHKLCRGKVLVGGLGLGHSAMAVAARKNVTGVVVVERTKHLCDTIGRHLEKVTNGKIKVIRADVWHYLGITREDAEVNTHGFDTLFIDIWNGYGGNKDYWQFKRLDQACRDAGKRAVAWG